MRQTLHQWFDRVRRQFGCYPGSSPMPPNARHAPISLIELRQRIMDSVAAELNPLGFERPSKKFELWVRRRTPYIYDLAGPHFVKSTSSDGCQQVSVSACLHLPIVEKIYHQLAGGVYRIQSGTAGKMLYLAYRKEHLPTTWYFWTTAYSEEATQMMVDQIINYGFPLLEQVMDYESLLSHPLLRAYPEKEAIILALVGRRDMAQRLLETSIEKQKSLLIKRVESLDTFPDWRTKVGLLKALRTGRFDDLVEKAQAGS